MIRVWLPALRLGTGTDVYAGCLAAALRSAGLQVTLDWFDRRFELCPLLLRAAPMPAGTQVIIANSWNAFAFARPGVGLIVVEHHCVFDPVFRPWQGWLQGLYHRHWIRRLALRGMQRSSAVVAVSRFTADGLLRGGYLGPVTVIHNWVDGGHFSPSQCFPAAGPAESVPAQAGRPQTGPAEPGLPKPGLPDHPLPGCRPRARGQAPFRLLFVGTLSHRKGADLLGPIMQRLGPAFHLSHAGQWPEALGKPPAHSEALGRLSDAGLLAAYRNADAFLFPSRFEGFGYVIAEAMACGLPVISSASSAMPELIAHEQTGLLCPVDDIDAFVAAARSLQADPVFAAHLGRRARARVLAQFSEPAACSAYVKLIEDAVAGRPP